MQRNNNLLFIINKLHGFTVFGTLPAKVILVCCSWPIWTSPPVPGLNNSIEVQVTLKSVAVSSQCPPLAGLTRRFSFIYSKGRIGRTPLYFSGARRAHPPLSGTGPDKIPPASAHIALSRCASTAILESTVMCWRAAHRFAARGSACKKTKNQSRKKWQVYPPGFFCR